MKILGNTLGILAVNVVVAALVSWKWNHEAVRVYDFPPVSYFAAYLCALPLSALWWWVVCLDRVTRRELREGRKR